MLRTCLLLARGSSSLANADGPLMSAALKGQDLWGTISTSKGEIKVHFFSKEAPQTVANFVGLAAGEKAFTDPETNQQTHRKFYDGLIFHRVIPDFMVQGGDPLATGEGGPGYTFEDEFQSGRRFDKVGLLAMANLGPKTNGSQFFITTSTPEHLNGHHTIFGEVISGYEVVVAIAAVPSRQSRPVTDVVIKSIKISQKPLKVAQPAPKKGTPK
jgi:peptidyl-prolyl cis-trans isomerase A (cyclophilin A)